MRNLLYLSRQFLLTTHSLVLSPKAKNYALLKRTWEEDYEDNHWAEDSIFLELNSRDFVARIARIGINAEAICETLSSHPRGLCPVPFSSQSSSFQTSNAS